MCKTWACWRQYLFSVNESCATKNAQQSVHLTLGILRKSQAVLHALSFFWLDGFAVPAPAQVTQTVRRSAENQLLNIVTSQLESLSCLCNGSPSIFFYSSSSLLSSILAFSSGLLLGKFSRLIPAFQFYSSWVL